jgi:hypothetical protein
LSRRNLRFAYWLCLNAGAATEWLDNTDWIERYAWFGAGEAQDLYGVSTLNRLQFDDGSLTALGRQYVGGRHS